MMVWTAVDRGGKVMEMLVKMAEVLVKIAVMMMVATAAFRRHRKRGGEAPPSSSSSSSSLTSSLDGRRVSSLVLVLHGVGGVRAPPRLDLSLCLSLFLRSLSGALSPFRIYMEIRNSDWDEILTRFLSAYWLSCGERRAPTALWGGDEGPGRS